MATKVHMEALSPTMEEGQLVRWLKAEGAPVSSGEVIAEIETDKATMELVARGEGVLRKQLVSEGATVPVGELIGIIAGPDEDIEDLIPSEPRPVEGRPATGPAPGPGAAPEAQPAGEGPEIPAPGPPEKSTPEGAPGGAEVPAGERVGRKRASPLARRMAREAALDLATLSGSGPGGRVVKRDVESALARAGAGGAAVSGDALSDYEDIPLSQMRKTIAKRLVESLSPVPHFFLRIQVDMSRVVEARSSLNALLEEEGDGGKVSLNDFILTATARALRRHPEVNAHWQGDFVRRFHRVHLGVAVAVEDGLITPVIRDADRKGLAAISREIRELAGRAREKALLPEEYTGATFSVSNLGMFGIEEFTAVINPPEAGILAVGAVIPTAVAREGAVAVRPMMSMTMSCDHRVVDGATGARFLTTLKTFLEEPATLLL